MPKNKIEDLRNLAMEAIERLLDPDDPMDAKKAVAISQLGNVIINSAKVELQSARMFGNPRPQFFNPSGGKEVMQLSGKTDVITIDAEMPDCKCGESIYPADFERSEQLALDYPRCSECISLLPTNGNDFNAGGK